MQVDQILGPQAALAGARRDLDQVVAPGRGREIRVARRWRSDRTETPISRSARGCARPSGLKKLTIIRCRFTVSEFMATTSVSAAPTSAASAGARALVVVNPRALRRVMTEHREAPPVGQFLFDVFARSIWAAARANGRTDTPAGGRRRRADDEIRRRMPPAGRARPAGARRPVQARAAQASLGRRRSPAGGSITEPQERAGALLGGSNRNARKYSGSCVSMLRTATRSRCRQ